MMVKALLFLVRVDLLGDSPTGHTAPVEAYDLAVAVRRYDPCPQLRTVTRQPVFAQLGEPSG